MLAHGATNSLSVRIRHDHERRVGNVRTGSTLIRPSNISANDLLVLFGDISLHVFTKPVRQRILARHLRIECVGVARRDHLVKNLPDRLVIGFGRRANIQHELVCNCRATASVAANVTAGGAPALQFVEADAIRPIFSSTDKAGTHRIFLDIMPLVIRGFFATQETIKTAWLPLPSDI